MRPAPMFGHCRSRAPRCCARCTRRRSGSASGSGVELQRPSSVAAAADGGDGALFVHGGTEVVPLLRDRILTADRLVDVRGIVPRGVSALTDSQQLPSDNSYPGVIVGAGTTL